MQRRPPVVLVHGFLSTPAMMFPLRRRLEREGLAVHSADLSPLAIQDVRRLADQLDATVERVRAVEGATRVDVVGVSQGGIIALWWAQHRDGWRRTHRLITLGAPFRGTWAAALGVPLFGLWSRGVWQLVPGSPLVAELVAEPLPADADVLTLSLRGDPVCPPDRCRLEGARNEVFDGPGGPLKHQWLIFSRPVAAAVLGALAAPPAHGSAESTPSSSASFT